MTETIKIEREGHLLLIGLNRPNKMNAFSLEMLNGLAEAFTILENDKGLWCGLVYTTGDHFTSGLDLAEVGPQVASGKPLFSKGMVDPLQTMGIKRTKPVVLGVRGYCLTVGMELILATDITIAHPETKFGQIEVKRGFIPFGGATVRMHQRCGWGNAMRYLLTGDIFSGNEAFRIGFVQSLAEDPFAEAKKIALAIANQAPLAVQATLKSARETLEEGPDKAIHKLMPMAIKLMKTKDAEEGMKSFIERREAHFTGN